MIKEMIIEVLDKTKITKIAVFDFDGTLIDTPLPTDGPSIYQSKTGKAWPHGGWWSKLDSLHPEIFDMPIVPSVKKTYDQEKPNKSTLMVMMTGRMKQRKVDFSTAVKGILDSKGFQFDKYLYNTGGDTCDIKIKYLNELLTQYPNVSDVLLNDDRISHIPRFEEWGKQQIDSGRLTEFNINVVPSNNHH